MGRARFLLTPRWLALHLLAATAVVTFVLCGLWQLRRWDEKKAHNELVAARQVLPEAPFAAVVPPSSTEVPEATFRSVTATGTYVVDDQVLVRNRSQNSAPGYWVLTPLRLSDGRAVVVNRGWVNYDAGYEDGPTVQASFAPPAGEVTVRGVVQATQVRDGGPVDPPDGRLAHLARADLGRLAAQVPYPVAPVRIDLVTQAPPQPGVLPAPVPPPELDEGPHLSYAGQWFIFAALTVVVYPLFLRRAVRNHREDRDGPVGEGGLAGDAPSGPAAPVAPGGPDDLAAAPR